MRFAVLAVLLTLAALPSPAAAAGDVDTLLARSRAAMGGAALDSLTGLHVEGTVDVIGIKGTLQQWFDITGRKFAEVQDAGPASGADGWDGHSAWSRDLTGIVHIDAGENTRFQAIDQAYFASNLLWAPDRGGAKVSLGTPQAEGGVTYDLVRVEPPGGAPFDLWLDPRGIPHKLVATVGAQTSTSTFSDYRTVAGIEYPYSQRSETSDGNSSVFAVTRVDPNPQGVAEQVVIPPSTAKDFSIAGGATSTTVPFELLNNHVYLNVRLNGKGPFRFIFDSGGVNIIDPSVAKAISVTGEGNAQSSGVGAETESTQLTTVKSLAVGEATITNQGFAVLPTHAGFGVAEGGTVDGLIGFEVLARFVTTFDYGARTVTLHMPGSGFTPPGESIPFEFNGETPMVMGAIDGVPARMQVDTGSRTSITILGAFAQAHPQIVPAVMTQTGVNGFGVGGASMGRLGRLRSVQIGPFTLNDLIGDFSEQRKGSFANPFLAANVGGGVWKRFAVTFDYPHQTMWLAPNSSLASRDSYDRSGLFLVTRNGALTVLDVRPGTPAAAAGVVKGDVVVSVDGKDAAAMPIASVRDILMGPSGTRVKLGVTEKGANRNVVLTLRDYA